MACQPMEGALIHLGCFSPLIRADIKQRTRPCDKAHRIIFIFLVENPIVGWESFSVAPGREISASPLGKPGGLGGKDL